MGTFGTSLKNTVNAIINNPNLRSDITIIALTKNAGSYGGYAAVTDTTVSTTSTYGIPIDDLKIASEISSHGSLRHGTVQVVVKASETITENTYDYTITWNGTSYSLKSVERPIWNGVVICQILELAKVVS